MEDKLNLRPTANDMNINVEFIYAVRIVEILEKIDLNKDCDKHELIKIIEKTFLQYKDEINLYK